METFSVQADVSGGPSAPARARQLASDVLSGRLPGAVLDDVVLLITELVANTVRHAGAGRERSVRLVLQGRRPGLRVEVVNPDHRRSAPVLRPPDLTGGGGIGLQLVNRLSTRWGVRETPQTVVWFELDC